MKIVIYTLRWPVHWPSVGRMCWLRHVVDNLKTFLTFLPHLHSYFRVLPHFLSGMTIQIICGSCGWHISLEQLFLCKKFQCSLSALLIRFLGLYLFLLIWMVHFEDYLSAKCSSHNAKRHKLTKCSVCAGKWGLKRVTYELHKKCFQKFQKLVPVAEGMNWPRLFFFWTRQLACD